MPWYVITKDGETVSRHKNQRTAEKAAFNKRGLGPLLVKHGNKEPKLPDWVHRAIQHKAKLKLLTERIQG
jgi:hypothetical protein